MQSLKKKFKQILYYCIQRGYDVNTIAKILIKNGFFATPQHIIDYLTISDEIERELNKPIEFYNEEKLNNLLLKQERILNEVLPMESLKSKFKRLLEQINSLDDIYNQLYFEYRRKLPLSKMFKALQSKKFIFDFSERAIFAGFDIFEIIDYLSIKTKLDKEKIKEIIEELLKYSDIKPGEYVLPVEED